MTSVRASGEEEDETRSHDDSDESDIDCVKRRRASSQRTNKLKYSSDEDVSEEASESSSPLSSSDEPSTDDDDDDDDDSDYTFLKTKKRRRKKPTRACRSQPSSSNKSQRRSTTAKQINYCEDSEHATDTDDIIYKYEDEEAKRASADSETIERVIKQRQGRVGAVGSKTAVYNVEEHGDPNAAATADHSTEPHYLIKWHGWSHLHNTWESRDSLLHQKVKGIKKLENFLRKEEERRALHDRSAMSPEDIEYLECQSEMMDNLLETHTIVERVISHNGNDYLCKWQGLPYSECTWEDGELIRKRFSPLIDEYQRRHAASTFPPVNVKSQRALRHRPKFVPLKQKPDYLGKGAELRDYQLDGLNWLANSWCRQNGVILADEMGLGKTVQAISFMSYVFNEHSVYGPFLIVIPLSTIQGWQREFQKWSPEINLVIYLGDSHSRSMIQKYEWSADNKRITCNAVLTTYEILLKDKNFFSSVSWAALVVDEAHRLKNEDSLLYRTLIKFDTNHRLLVTGTPLQNSLKELWSLLHFIMPDKFNQWDEFDAKYSSVLQDGLRFQDLHKELQPYLLRRVKKDVEKSLPAKVEQILRVEMTKQQKQFYKLILTKNYKELLKGSKGNVSTFLNIMMELKKCSNHTYLIRRDEDKAVESQLDCLIRGSGKLFLLDKLLRRLKETGHRVLIFSQMVRMLDLIAEYLQYRRFSFQRLDGSIKGEVRRQALDHFNKPDSEDFCFLLSTRAGGLGINLSTADTVIIYDSDWNPQNDLQAQARAHRIGQKNQVNIYRLVSKNSIEEDIVERAKQKMVLDHLVIQRMDTTGRTVLNSRTQTNSNPFTKDEINSILKFGAEELFKEDMESKSDDKDYDIDEILKRAETREETNEQTAGDELLSQFKVATFSTTEDDKSWTDIIPESERHKMDVDEETEKLKLFSETRRQRVQKPKWNAKSDDDEYANESANSSDSEARLKTAKKSKIKSQSVFAGLNSNEIRRFVRSYRKYPCPLERIDTVAQDAQLEEKSQACLIEFASRMRELCVQAIEENKDKKDVTMSKKGPCVDINGAKINAQQMLDAEKYFEPLGHYASHFDQFEFKTKLKQTYWDCEWSNEHDRALLKGVLEHGYGNWESIKADTALGLSDKILVTMSTGKKSDKSDGAKLKPQSKHLRTRIDYLMKVLQNQTNTEKYGKNWKDILNGTAAKRKNKNDSDAHSDAEHSDVSDKCVKKKRVNSADDCHNENSGDHVTHECDDAVQPSVKRHAKKTNVKVDKKEAKMDKSKIVLSEKIFEECKNILRPVKRALKSLNQLDSVKDFEEIKRHLLQIGDKINDHLTIYSDPEKINLWRNYLWAFVSKFTVKWNWEKLKNLYKKFCNSRDHDLYTQSQLATNGSYASSSYSATTTNHINHTNNHQQQQHHNHHHHYSQNKYYSKKNHGYHGNHYGNTYQQQWGGADKSESRSYNSRSRDQDVESDVYRSKSYSSLSGHSSQAGLLGASPMFSRQFNKPHSPSSSPYSRRLSSSSSSHRTGDSCKKLKESRETSPSRDNHNQHGQHHSHHHHN